MAANDKFSGIVNLSKTNGVVSLLKGAQDAVNINMYGPIYT